MFRSFWCPSAENAIFYKNKCINLIFSNLNVTLIFLEEKSLKMVMKYSPMKLFHCSKRLHNHADRQVSHSASYPGGGRQLESYLMCDSTRKVRRDLLYVDVHIVAFFLPCFFNIPPSGFLLMALSRKDSGLMLADWPFPLSFHHTHSFLDSELW